MPGWNIPGFLLSKTRRYGMEKIVRDMFEVTRNNQRIGLFYELEEAQEVAQKIDPAYPAGSIRVYGVTVEFLGDAVLTVNRNGMV
jgi:hypothetical protein